MANPYESDRLLAEYLWFHYPAEQSAGIPLPEQAADFARRVVGELIDPSRPAARALDVGCAVGRSSFELARTVPSVLGVDFSKTFIDAALKMKTDGAIESSIAVEGDQRETFTAKAPEGVNRSRVDFETGDAMALRQDLGAFDIVLAANLICRLPEPRRFLERLPSLVSSGGQLLLATPFSWLREFTPERNWLGGRENGSSGWDALSAILSEHFVLEFTKDLPFLIREHSRKYQYGISLGSRWRRR